MRKVLARRPLLELITGVAAVALGLFFMTLLALGEGGLGEFVATGGIILFGVVWIATMTTTPDRA